MILLVCPECKQIRRHVQTKMTIVATSWVQIIAGRNTGIEQAIATPMRRESTAPTRILPTEIFICPRCHTETAVEKWKYIVTCDQCEKKITGSIKNPNRVVNAQICRDTGSIYCNVCWVRNNTAYCGECRFRSECERYNR